MARCLVQLQHNCNAKLCASSWIRLRILDRLWLGKLLWNLQSGDCNHEQPITETANLNVLITITSSPPTGSGYVIVDGSPTTTPHTFSWTPSSTHTIAANSPVFTCGPWCRYVYLSWSDGLGQSHSISPSIPGTYTVNFQKQYYLNMSFIPTDGGSVTPASGWYNEGYSTGITASSSENCIFRSWVGAGTGNYTGKVNKSTITMNGPINETSIFDCGTNNSMQFTGYLNYSNGQPVSTSMIRFTLSNNTLGYSQSSFDKTDLYGHFLVKVTDIPQKAMNADLDISIYVLGDVEALYDCWYNHTSGRCCGLPLKGTC